MNKKTDYNVIDSGTGVPVKAWTRGVPFEDEARAQVLNVARLPFVHKWVAVMPDVHAGKGATIGSVIPCEGAIIPAAVGVDIGCGMMAAKTSLSANDLPDTLAPIRSALAALRARNQVRVFSDCIDEANAAMDALWVFRKSPPAFDKPEQVNDLRAKTAVAAYLYRRCVERAPATIAEAPEFKRIMGGTLESLGRMWAAIDAADEERVISILREIRSFDRMVWRNSRWPSKKLWISERPLY